MRYLIILLSLLWVLPCYAEEISKAVPEKTTVKVESPKKFGRLLQEMESTDEKGIKHERKITWTYYKTGEVDVITIERYKAGKLVSIKEIKHYLDGKQPTVKVTNGMVK